MRVEEAGRQPAEAAVAEAGVPLGLAQVLQAVARARAAPVGALVEQAQVDQAVAQRAAHQELQRQVVDALGVLLVVGVLRADPALDQPVAHGQGQGDVRLPLAVHVLGQLGQRVLEVPEDRLLERLGVDAERVVRQALAWRGSLDRRRLAGSALMAASRHRRERTSHRRAGPRRGPGPASLASADSVRSPGTFLDSRLCLVCAPDARPGRSSDPPPPPGHLSLIHEMLLIMLARRGERVVPLGGVERTDADADGERVRGAAEDHAAERADVAVVAAPAERDVALRRAAARWSGRGPPIRGAGSAPRARRGTRRRRSGAAGPAADR